MDIVYLVFLFFLPAYLYIWFILENDVRRVLLDRNFIKKASSADRIFNQPQEKK